MNELRKAAEMALEAFMAWETLEDVEQAHGSHSEWFKEPLKALRQALAQPGHECICSAKDMPFGKCCKVQSEQEPVAWINYNAATSKETINRDCHSELASTPLYKTPLQNEITCVCGAVWDGELMTIPPRENKQEPVGTYQDVMQKMLALRHGSLEQMQAYDYLKNTLLYDTPPSIEAAVLAEREACARVCDELQAKAESIASCFDANGDECAEAIRARGEK